MGRLLIILWLALGLFVLADANASARTFTVFVSSNGWHTDIAVARSDIPAGRIPESADFPSAALLQFGWGDADYYAEPEPGVFTTLGAAFPGPAVVHLAGLSQKPSETFTGVEQIELTLDEAKFARLVDYLHESFERAGAARAKSTGQGVYSFSRFYAATGEFHAFNTCNTWTARGLAAAGLDVDASGVKEAEDVMRQLRKRASAETSASKPVPN
jgi:uncharacterized protein (TIGR02117 family)